MTDYLITMDTGEKYLMHHGVKGQKWGVWNEETRARYNQASYGGGGASVEDDGESEDIPKKYLNEGKYPFKSSEELDAFLDKYGINLEVYGIKDIHDKGDMTDAEFENAKRWAFTYWQGDYNDAHPTQYKGEPNKKEIADNSYDIRMDRMTEPERQEYQDYLLNTPDYSLNRQELADREELKKRRSQSKALASKYFDLQHD